MKGLQYLLVLVPLGLQTWLAVLLVTTGEYQRFRIFFAYTSFAIPAGILKVALYNNYRAYFVAYWLTEPVYIVVGTLAMLETFPIVFKSFSWTRQFRAAIWIGIGLMFVISVMQAIFSPPLQAPFTIAMIYSFGIGARYIQSGILVAFIILSVLYGIRPRRYPLGILFGFWLITLAYLIGGIVRSEFGTRFKFLFTYMPGMVYVFAVLVWLITFLKPEPPDRFEEVKSPLSPEQMIERIRRMTKTIKGSRQ
jgi:hypothetical protein